MAAPIAHHDDALAAVLDDALHIAEESRPLLHRPMKVGVHGQERDAHSFAFLAVSITLLSVLAVGDDDLPLQLLRGRSQIGSPAHDQPRSQLRHWFAELDIAFDWMTFCFFAGWTASSSESSEPSLSSAGAAALDDALDLLGGAAALDDSLGLVGGAAAIDGALAVAAGGAVATLGALDPSGVALAALAVAGAGATLAALKAFGIALTALDANGGGAALAALASSLSAGCDGGEGAAWACVEGASAACEGIPGIIMPGTTMPGIIVPPCCICMFIIMHCIAIIDVIAWAAFAT